LDLRGFRETHIVDTLEQIVGEAEFFERFGAEEGELGSACWSARVTVTSNVDFMRSVAAGGSSRAAVAAGAGFRVASSGLLYSEESLGAA
jgi:hypothetical protein